jgi:aldehyde:ferredoxin oxidoreductase
VGPIPLPPIDQKKYEKILDKYYELRGWTKEGNPTRKKLDELGLQEVADALGKAGLIAKTDESLEHPAVR